MQALRVLQDDVQCDIIKVRLCLLVCFAAAQEMAAAPTAPIVCLARCAVRRALCVRALARMFV
jgi:hypothetical protein